jgi:IclR helix-turn-helix domain
VVDETDAEAGGLASGGGYQRIQAVDRAVALLKAVADSTTAPTVLELAQACGINRSTAWRLLRTLEYHGLVDRDAITQRYTKLAVRTGESVTLAVAKRFNLVYVDQVDPPELIMPSWLGKPLPLHATSGHGQPHGLVPVGIGVYGTTGRLEKGYRAYGAELDASFDLVEAGARPRVSLATCSAASRYSLQTASCWWTPRAAPPTSPAPARRRRSGKHLLMAYLPKTHAVAGTRLSVEYFGERYPVTVAVAGSTPLFDPENDRVRR